MSIKINSKQNWLFLSVIFFTIFVYYPGLKGPLILDDFHNLQPLKYLQTDLFSWIDIIKMMPHGIERPIPSMSFIFNWNLFGDDVSAFKATNLLIHLLCGLFVFLISKKLITNSCITLDYSKNLVAVWVAAFWLLSPIHVSTVLYVVQRMAQFETLFVLIGIYSYLVGRELLEKENIKASVICFIGTFFFFWPLAIFSKENAVLLPFFTAIIELFYLNENSPWRKKILRIHLILLLLISIVFIILVFTKSAYLFGAYDVRQFSLYERLLTQSRILFDYIGNILMLPGSSPFGIFHDDYIKSTGLFNPVTTLIAIICWFFILLIPLSGINKKTRIILGGVFFFIAGHLVESSIFPLEMYFEHRNYLPGFGICLSSGFLINYLYNATKLKKCILILSILYLLIALVYTSNRVANWQSWDNIILASEASHPLSRRTNAGLANLYINKGEVGKAIYYLDIADALDDGERHAGVLITKLIAYCKNDQMPDASIFNDIKKISGLSDDFYTLNALDWLTNLIEDKSCGMDSINKIVSSLNKKLETDGALGNRNQKGKIYVYMARMLTVVGMQERGLNMIQKALTYNPEDVSLLLLEIRYLLDLGFVEDARYKTENLNSGNFKIYKYQRSLLNEYKKELIQKALLN